MKIFPIYAHKNLGTMDLETLKKQDSDKTNPDTGRNTA
jgi:hypothetical protein